MKKNYYPGKFIVFEGLDGSGQSTQASLLVEYLKKRGKNVLLTKEPTKWTSAGKKINAVLDGKIKPPSALGLQKLFVRDRAEHLKEEIIPALKFGRIVISDRYFFSTLAFGGLSVSLEKLVKLNSRFIYPDKIIFLDVSAKECVRRIKKRAQGVKFFEKLEKLKKVMQNYRRVCRMFPDVYVADGEREIKKIHQDIADSLSGIL